MPEPQAVMRFTRLRLENWRNFRTAEVDLAGRVFLVGPNAAGKSNLLDAFRFLRDVASVGGGLQAAVAKREGVSRFRSLSARRVPGVAIEVAVGTDDDPGRWQYLLWLGGDGRLRQEKVWRAGEIIHERPNDEDRADPQRLTQTSLEQVNLNREFRELAGFLTQVHYLHLVPQLVREPDRSVGRVDDPFGGDFLERLARTTKRTREARLNRIVKALRVAVPQLDSLRLEADPRGAWHLKGRYVHWRPQGAWQTEQELSDGTLRLLGLLWAVLDGSGPLLLEEPELSLHPEVVRWIPQLFHRVGRSTGRQILVSTHSSDLLADPGIGLDEVLLLRPESEGTVVEPASAKVEIEQLLRAGLPLADVISPHTRPAGVEQLALFGG